MRLAKQNHKTRRTSPARVPQRALTVAPASRADNLSTELQLSKRSTLAEICPGDIVFLDEVSAIRETCGPEYVAVLACPWCGSPGLITAAQFSGAASIVCTSKNCSGLFRIVNEAQLVPIPPI